ncbi:MAG: hypothetical protein IKW13_08275, partial [Thermoguttaceae bacterium]|nr:hypothetical protein [Thermoguttaceae bacterium]
MNGLYSNAEKGEDAKERKGRLLRAFVGAVALLGGAFVVGCDASVGNVETPSATRVRLTVLEDALESARNEQARIAAATTKLESEARRTRLEFRRAFFRLEPDERDVLLEDMLCGELSAELRKRPDAATAFAKQSEWFEIECERKKALKLSERFAAEIARAESERTRWARRLELEETLAGVGEELDAENGSVELIAVVERLRALTEEVVAGVERPFDAISPEEVLAFEETKENAFETLVGGENGANETTREAAGIPELPTFDPDELAEETPSARKLFESQGAEIVDAANREIQNALDAGATDVAFAATLDAAAKLVELAETLG